MGIAVPRTGRQGGPCGHFLQYGGHPPDIGGQEGGCGTMRHQPPARSAAGLGDVDTASRHWAPGSGHCNLQLRQCPVKPPEVGLTLFEVSAGGCFEQAGMLGFTAPELPPKILPVCSRLGPGHGRAPPVWHRPEQ